MHLMTLFEDLLKSLLFWDLADKQTGKQILGMVICFSKFISYNKLRLFTILIQSLLISLCTNVSLRADMAPTDSLTLYEAFQHNRMIEGVEARQKEAAQDAKKSLFFIYESEYQLLEVFLAKHPQNLFLHYNFGILWLPEDIQKSVMQFLFTLRKTDELKLRYFTDHNRRFNELKFRAAFNLGTLYGYDKRLKNNNDDYIDQALKYYQTALEIKPDSLETRQNIEMLFLRQASQQQQEGDSKKQDQKKHAKQDSSKQQDQSGEDKNISYEDNQKGKQEQKKFQSKDLTKRDVQDILEELRQQEQQIWEKLIQEQDKKRRDQRKGRDDWMSKDIFNQETSEDQDLDKDW